ncbi:MAG: DNA alkylation repair protein [Longimicrobiales bacterium]
MPVSARAEAVLEQAKQTTRLGDLRRLAKEVGTDHHLAMELWSSGALTARQLAILVMDKKSVTQEFVDTLDDEVQVHGMDDRLQLFDWLMANQLNKTRGGKALLESWESSPSPLQRRLFWYNQARLRWTGQAPPPNTEHLLDALDARMEGEVPEVQWAMNFTAGQIGTYQPQHRSRCIALGERTGLYENDVVPSGCTPSYLPDFIEIQVAKLPS